MPTVEPTCLICQSPFIPNKYSGKRQVVCGSVVCRKAAKKQRQANWLAGNPDYFRGPEHVERVRQWRRAHPESRRKRPTPPTPLAAESTPKTKSCNQAPPSSERLQDSVLPLQTAWFLGLASLISGSVLQDEVHEIVRECLRRGRDLQRLDSGGALASEPTNTR